MRRCLLRRIGEAWCSTALRTTMADNWHDTPRLAGTAVRFSPRFTGSAALLLEGVPGRIRPLVRPLKRENGRYSGRSILCQAAAPSRSSVRWCCYSAAAGASAAGASAAGASAGAAGASAGAAGAGCAPATACAVSMAARRLRAALAASRLSTERR